jgi:hypothetical protein
VNLCLFVQIIGQFGADQLFDLGARQMFWQTCSFQYSGACDCAREKIWRHLGNIKGMNSIVIKINKARCIFS